MCVLFHLCLLSVNQVVSTSGRLILFSEIRRLFWSAVKWGKSTQSHPRWSSIHVALCLIQVHKATFVWNAKPRRPDLGKSDLWPYTSLWYLHVLFSMIIFTDEHCICVFWSVNGITRSKKLLFGHKWTTSWSNDVPTLRRSTSNLL